MERMNEGIVIKLAFTETVESDGLGDLVHFQSNKSYLKIRIAGWFLLLQALEF